MTAINLSVPDSIPQVALLACGSSRHKLPRDRAKDRDTEALTTQDRRKRQKCLQLSASETATASSSSSVNHRQCTQQKHLQLWDLVVASIHSSDPAYPAYLFSYWADWAQDHYKRPLSRAAPAVQANLQNASVQCNRQLPEDIHGIAAVPGSVQQLRREATYKSL